MEQYKMFELKFEGSRPNESEAIVDLEAVFMNGRYQDVRGHYEDRVFLQYLGRHGSSSSRRIGIHNVNIDSCESLICSGG